MSYLDFDRLEALDSKSFRAARPFPWINPQGLLSEDGYLRLLDTLPPVSSFSRIFGKRRSYGQQSHNRLALEYSPDLELAEPWREFINELESKRYAAFLQRMFGRRGLKLSFHWHYTPRGCSVSPHCDAAHKLGSHIFYLNREDQWDPHWGGETVVLDDNGRFDHKSAPAFEDFDSAVGSEATGNRSLLFARGAKSWHGVREITCPEGQYRKVFIAVVNDWPRLLGKQALERFLRRGVAA